MCSLWCSPQLARSVVLRGLFPIAIKLGPASFRRWIVERTPIENVQQLRRISDVMHNRSVQIFNEKKAMLESGDDAIKHQIGEGRDIMSILREFLRPVQRCTCVHRRRRLTELLSVRENMLALENDKLPDNELIAQVS